ncbi:DUF2784 domain-containing protein [Pseudomonas aeruginosa]|nr:DUF2784 domain-containing protein [Pseudomonas aeruginosa]
MSYRLAADALVWLHLGFILFVLFGGLLPLRWATPGLAAPAGGGLGCAVEFLGLPCPLTPLENRLRRAAGDAGYSGGFVEHYLLPLIYPAGLTPAVQWILGAIVLLVNLIAYLYLWHRRGSR